MSRVAYEYQDISPSQAIRLPGSIEDSCLSSKSFLGGAGSSLSLAGKWHDVIYRVDLKYIYLDFVVYSQHSRRLSCSTCR